MGRKNRGRGAGIWFEVEDSEATGDGWTRRVWVEESAPGATARWRQTVREARSAWNPHVIRCYRLSSHRGGGVDMHQVARVETGGGW